MLQQSVDPRHAINDEPLQLSVVIPTKNEAGNVEPLLERLGVALAGIEWEAIFVDDSSTDGTPELLTRIAQSDRRVRLIRRIGRRGLSSAVVEGALASTTPIVAVIDADLQHDEKVLPDLYRAIADKGHELAIGTRYAANGSTGEWAEDRLKISRFATALASPIMKTRLSDPMSGFFAVRRDILLEAAPRLSTVGYKILLDLVASHPRPLKVAEVGYTFGTRQHGESKLDEMVALEYLELLLDKAIGRFVPVKLVQFGAIGMLGVGVHLTLLYMAMNMVGAPFATSQALAVIGAMTFNFALNNKFTYRDQQLKGFAWVGGLFSFYLVCSLGAVANVGIGSLVYEQFHGWWIAGIAGAIVGSVWNYVASSWLTWTKR
ncbi:glycosyltransferase family 2 protein [Sphingomonas sp. NSE70-1]|uniref:Glycosyltransferase family 2 protein n=1 Tax=Sphingomonas caseinilyticus TaxID=2908205 RepID=A0ABT0RQ84_9SPHN|nr:glycosyltransferase family 2 protein [Sphingomonas caseinilyticus]MCL6697180.1 glycosyltransferase family 2 protein [Sphingomonas caseinilyticus]